MIVLDTHIWVWWVHGDPQLPHAYRTELEEKEADGLGISVISCWEVANPADQLIVATARVYGCPLMTVDDKILHYPYVLKSP